MKPKKLLLFGLWMAVTALIALVVALPVAAHDQDRECSLKTLKGGYGLDEAGTILVPPPPQLYVLSGIGFYDGNGNFSGSVTLNLGIALPATFTGTYTVNSDCTYSDSVEVVSPLGPTPLTHKGMVVGDGMSREVLAIASGPGTVAAVTIRKTPVGRCSLRTLKGTYGLLGEGTVMIPSNPPISVVQAGTLTFDGAGNFSGEDTANLGGSSTTANFTGTYAVNPDCTASAVVNTVLGFIHQKGVITGEGEFQEVHGIFTDSGWVFAQTLKKQ